MTLIRLIIVDEIEYLRLGLKTAFDDVGDMEVVGDFGEPGDVMDAVESLFPDVALMSVNRQADYGLSMCREIRGSEVIGESIADGLSGQTGTDGGLDHGRGFRLHRDGRAKG